MDTLRHRILVFIERASWAAGLCGLVWLGVFHIEAAAGTRQALERFAIQAAPDSTADSIGALDPLGVLRIPHIRLEVPVLPGTGDAALDRGVGHIEGTAHPGTDGNSGIAGHRDGFFRGLKDVTPGDAIELATVRGTDVYRVDRIWVVDPEDVSVLDPTPTRALTLVTCYPFYFVGSAPKRFIVRAVHVEPDVVSSRPRRIPVFWPSHVS